MATRSSRSSTSNGSGTTGSRTDRSSDKAGNAAGGNPAEALAGMHRQFVQPLKGMAEEVAQRMQALPVAGALLQNGRKDLETLMRANQKSYEGLQALVQRQTEMMKESIVEWQQTVQGMSPGAPRENIAKLDEMGKAAFKDALNNIKELSELAASSQAQAFELVRQRIGENIEEASKLLKSKRK